MDFKEMFDLDQSLSKTNSKRDRFISRLFGIFSEEIIRIGFRNSEDNQYRLTDIGRPTLYLKNELGEKTKEKYTLDFTLCDENGDLYITEMKCELEYKGYQYLELTHKEQVLRHKKKPAFAVLLDLAQAIKNNQAEQKYAITCNGESIDFKKLKGIALIWGRTTAKGVEEVKQSLEFCHVISVEEVVNYLVKNNNLDYYALIKDYENWCDLLFTQLRN